MLKNTLSVSSSTLVNIEKLFPVTRKTLLFSLTIDSQTLHELVRDVGDLVPTKNLSFGRLKRRFRECKSPFKMCTYVESKI
jgi:hypothetical protein